MVSDLDWKLSLPRTASFESRGTKGWPMALITSRVKLQREKKKADNLERVNLEDWAVQFRQWQGSAMGSRWKFNQ